MSSGYKAYTVKCRWIEVERGKVSYTKNINKIVLVTDKYCN